MKNHLKTTYFTGQEAFFVNRGDEFWELICDHFTPDETFVTSQVVALILSQTDYTRRTAYLYATALLANLVAIEEGGLFKSGPSNQGKNSSFRFHDENGQ